MPYTKTSDVPDYVPADKKKQWMEVWNSVHAAQKKAGASDKTAESEAFKQANGVVKKETKSMAGKKEVRTITGLKIELREGQGDEMALVGYAARFNQQSRNLGGFVETIAPGAFTQSLKDQDDVKVTFNHDPNQVLGRTKSGTATVEQDADGLKFRCQLDPTNTMHRNLYASVKRGDIDECSFAFTVNKDGQQWAESNGNEDFFAVRTLTSVKLIDVSAVTYPAYYGTDVQARALFPEGEVPEIRSAISVAKRARAESFEAQAADIWSQMNDCLKQQFGYTDRGDRKFYGPLETYTDHIIACSYDTDDWDGTYYSIPYTKEEGKYVYGEPTKVELDWVPSERELKLFAEYRANAQHLAEEHKQKAADAQAQADAHNAAAKAIEDKEAEKKAYREDYGLNENEEYEDNVMCDPEDVYFDEEDDCMRAAAKEAVAVEARANGGKVRTKKVGGKNLTKDKFAFVGDANDTSTWKFPIHDADHVRNALARWGQAKGIPADKKAGVYRKIVAAAKKFNIEVSAEDSSRALAECPMDADEVGDRLRQLKALMLKA